MLPPLPLDRRLELKKLGDAFVSTLSYWKAIDALEDEFFYTIPDELFVVINTYRASIASSDRDRRLMTGELSIVAASYRRARKVMKNRGLHTVAERLYVEEQAVRGRIWLRERRYDRFLLNAVLKVTSKYGTSAGRFFLTCALVDLTFAILSMSSLDYGQRQRSFVNALYWSTITLTTVGYGDIVPRDRPVGILLAGTGALAGAVLIGLFLHLLIRRLLIEEEG